jgi:FG-GAP-like repeat
MLFSCTKNESSSITPPTSTTPTVPPTSTTPTTPTYPTVFKNYLQASYELQKSSVNIDLEALRKENNQKSGFILAIAYLDINSDGIDDIFLNAGYGSSSTDRSYGEIYIFNKSTGKYQIDNTYFNTGQTPSLIHARKAFTGDFNNDNKPDIFITGHGWDQPPFPGEYTQMLLSENGKYKLVEFKDKIGFYHGACSGDIDKDGDLDIFVLGGNNSYFLINDSKGNFTYSTKEIDLNKLGGQYHCELFDVDKDGFLDLVLGGHEYDVKDNSFVDKNSIDGSTRIYWGSNSNSYSTNLMTNIPVTTNWGVITDLDFADLDNDNIFEFAITRTGGALSNNQVNYFYWGWSIQIVKINSRKVIDVTSTTIEQNTSTFGYSIGQNNPWIVWMRFEDYDNNGKIDFFSTKCGGASFVRWELQNSKLIRVN